VGDIQTLKVSLIITTYNWPEALAVVLRSVLCQTWPDFEVIVADDGSAMETADTVQQILTPTPIPWRHIRHADNGIRQARVKNMAVRYASGSYFIFIDHDVALHPEFIADHVHCADAETFLQGKRVFLSSRLTRRYIQAGDFSLPSPWAPGLENRKNGFRFPGLAQMVNRKKRFQVTLRGCNLSMHRDTFMAIDGYDELFDGLWGREDSDICYRMFNRGIQIKNLWLAGLQFHLHHPSIKRKGRDRLDQELDTCLKEKRKTAITGYSKLSSEGEIILESRTD
jgi:glycosyltransferase involved in cell wall biosynthesis